MADATDKMREALKLAEAALMGRNMNMTVVRRKIREALAQQPEQHAAPCGAEKCPSGMVCKSPFCLAEQPEQGEAVADAERRAILWERLHDKRVEQLRERDAEIAKLTAPPAPSAPEVERIAERLMSSDVDFDDCEEAAEMIRRLAAAPPAPNTTNDEAEYLLNLCRVRPSMGNKEIIAEMREVFDTPPAPSVSVPDAKDEIEFDGTYGVQTAYRKGWNACRAAMLASGGKASVPDDTARDVACYRHIRDSIGGGRLVEDFAYSDLDAALDAEIAAAAAAQR